MTKTSDAAHNVGLASLRRFVRKAPPAEHCDLCAAVIPEQHPHLLDPQTRRLFCACAACAILFNSDGQTHYRRVPRDLRHLTAFVLTDAGWNSLGIPIGLAFIYRSTTAGEMVAVYPSPAGPTEAVLDCEAWDGLVLDNPTLARIAPDVEALLIHRMNGSREYFIAPIDECYRLAGIVRKYWRGFSGGDEAFAQLRSFFDGLAERASPIPANSYARSVV